LALRAQSHHQICASQRPETDLPRPPARPRGLQVHVRRQSGDRLVGAQLLLQMRQRRRRSGLSGRGPERGQIVQSRARLGESDSPEDDHALLFVIRMSVYN